MNKPLLTLLVFMFSLSLVAQEIEVPQTQRSLITKRTATWCSICGGSAWDTFESVFNNTPEALTVAAHHSSSSMLHSSTAQNLVDAFEVSFGQPVFFFNEARVAGANFSSLDNIAKMTAQENPVAQTGLKITYDGSDNTLYVQTKTKFFQAAEGDYFLAVILARKQVVGFQSNRSNMATHKNVLHTTLSGEITGDALLSGSIAADTEQDQTFSTILPDDLSDLNNLRVISILWKKNAESFEVVNINDSDVVAFGTVNTAALAKLEQGFQLMPSVTTQSSTVQLELDESLSRVEFSLLNAQGQLIQFLYKGSLTAGTHQFLIEKTASMPAGLYFVRVQTPFGVVSKELILK